MTLEIIDSHQHFWQLATGHYGWLKPQAGAIYRDFTPADLAPEIAACGVAGTVLVQAADSEIELELMTDYAAQAGFVLGIVAPLELARDGAAKRIAAMAANRLLVGFRPPIAGILGPDGALLPASLPALDAMADHGLALDCLVRPQHLAALPDLAERLPGLRLIIDHCGGPDLGGNAPGPQWLDDMRALAAQANVYCKLSGLMTLLPDGADDGIIARHIDALVETFGSRRLLWGSDWPVLTRAASYSHWLDFCHSHFSTAAEADQIAIFGGTARRAYRLKGGRE